MPVYQYTQYIIRFLLPALHIHMVLERRTIRKRREALENLPEGLAASFTSTINRIRQSGHHTADLGMKVLMWLHISYRPLTVQELQVALAVELGDQELAMDNIMLPQRLLDCCLGLVVIDAKADTVRFVHFTLEEHFKKHSSMYFIDPSQTAAMTCLTYLNFPELSDYTVTDPPLAKYAFF